MIEKFGRKNFLASLITSALIAFLHKNDSLAGDMDTAGSSIPRKKIGNTGISVPILQLGTSQILNTVYDKVLHLCFREGAAAYDTALNYGSGASHAAIANFLKQIGDRKKVWITSKSGSGSADGIIKGADRCLREMKTDYLDLYLMHGISDRSMLRKEFLAAGEKVKNSGKARLFGFSAHSNCAEVMSEAAKAGGIDVILFTYNFRLFGDKELQKAMDACRNRGISLFAMKTWGSVPEDAEAVIRFRSKNFTLGQAKLKAVWADERIDSIVSEMTNTTEAGENIAAARSGAPLGAGELHQLNRLAALTAHAYCTGCSGICGSAMLGSAGVSDILRYLMYHDSYGKKDHARMLYRELPAEARRISVKDAARAGKACPQGIDVAAMIARAKKELGS